jgi:beta-1,4-galactosyltransferase 3
MAVAVSRWKYCLTYPKYCGGITAISKDNVRQIQGFSNTFYGWGGEDDDLYNRLIAHNLTIERYPSNIARYKMLKHDADLKEMMEKSEGDKLFNEGLSTIKYKLKKFTQLPLYTKIQVKLPVPPKNVSPEIN